MLDLGQRLRRPRATPCSQACANLAAGGVNGITDRRLHRRCGEAVARDRDGPEPGRTRRPTTAPTCDDAALVPVPTSSSTTSRTRRAATGRVDPISGPNGWFYPQNPNLVGFDATYATSGTRNFWGYDLPTTARLRDRDGERGHRCRQGGFLRFNHSYGFEDDPPTRLRRRRGRVLDRRRRNLERRRGADRLAVATTARSRPGRRNPLAGRERIRRARATGYGSSRVNLASSGGPDREVPLPRGDRLRASTTTAGSSTTSAIYACKSPVPETTIDKLKAKKVKGKGKRKKGKATLRFSGVSQIDPAPARRSSARSTSEDFKPCDSPEKLKKLKVEAATRSRCGRSTSRRARWTRARRRRSSRSSGKRKRQGHR